MNGASQQWWFVARSSGLVAWALITASIVWGLVLATRVLGRRPTGPWLFGMHRYLSGLAVAFTAIHVGAVVADTFVHFSWADVLVPFASQWHPVAVAWGIVSLYFLLAIQLTSVLRRFLPMKLWRNVHMLSYPLFQVSTIHLLSAGTDSRRLLPVGAALAIGTVAVLLGYAGYFRSEQFRQSFS